MTIELDEKTMTSLMREALEEAERGLSEGEGPIGCVIAPIHHGEACSLSPPKKRGFLGSPPLR